ncbi:sigma-54-dependent Fis family transcriptional regulator [Arenicella chitinivorans]|uniref:Sigma-54-dependent Fis family transcriptional regulator n=1 Tax=Arenicella chitinivorans TaxID=1329800 RepID=A0A918S259_9GAMM|nr:sigma-54 dependent transcriptional regulator [Arenicella chitinivorans]GHA17380.1 sigma-54-dependent Fis family transcriptional regulator [Arenicella chitinivorans]
MNDLSQILEGFDVPAILVTADYQILATNTIYSDKFGSINLESNPKCFAVSHGYDKPCDLAGEDCPLLAAKSSGNKEKVLHIHQTPNGREHVDVEMIPIFDDEKQLKYFIELLRPVPLASGHANTRQLVGDSVAFKAVLANATRVAKSDVNVLLQGESGTGKEMIAHVIHLASDRAQQAMVTLECAGLSETLIESELFGHKKGAFTGAHNEKEGLVAQSDGGTLFLDEIGDVSLSTQVKLLRLIETKTYRRVGDTAIRTSNFRLICATNRDLSTMVERGEFRLDLLYRINVFPITIPPLRERSADIPGLIQHMLSLVGGDFHFTKGAVEYLKTYAFPGNIRELRNIVHRATILCETNIIDQKCLLAALDLGANRITNTTRTTLPSLKENELLYLETLRQQFGDDKEKMAAVAGISLRTLYRKLEQITKIS